MKAFCTTLDPSTNYSRISRMQTDSKDAHCGEEHDQTTGATPTGGNMRSRLEEMPVITSVMKLPPCSTTKTVKEVHPDIAANPWIPPPPPIFADPSAGPQRKKRWHHKTRTGCLTCRRRRVKCDEQKPSCQRCCKVNERCSYETSVPEFTLIRYRPSKLPSASDKLDLSFLDFFMVNTKDTLSVPRSSLVDHRPVMILDSDIANERFWDSLGFPLVHMEPLILEMVVLLARKHRRIMEKSESSDEDLLEFIEVMSKIVKTRPRDVVVIGLVLAHAFQVLHQTSMEDYSSSDGDCVHAIAFSKLVLNSSDAVFEYVKPLTDIASATMAVCVKSTRDERSIELPTDFLDLEDARYHFAEILKLPLLKVRPALEKWLRVMSKLNDSARGKDWERSKNILTLFVYGRHILMIADVFTTANPELHAVWEAADGRALYKSSLTVPAQQERPIQWVMA